jgi:hypothetical protein
MVRCLREVPRSSVIAPRSECTDRGAIRDYKITASPANFSASPITFSACSSGAAGQRSPSSLWSLSMVPARSRHAGITGTRLLIGAHENSLQ